MPFSEKNSLFVGEYEWEGPQPRKYSTEEKVRGASRDGSPPG